MCLSKHPSYHFKAAVGLFTLFELVARNIDRIRKNIYLFLIYTAVILFSTVHLYVLSLYGYIAMTEVSPMHTYWVLVAQNVIGVDGAVAFNFLILLAKIRMEI